MKKTIFWSNLLELLKKLLSAATKKRSYIDFRAVEDAKLEAFLKNYHTLRLL